MYELYEVSSPKGTYVFVKVASGDRNKVARLMPSLIATAKSASKGVKYALYRLKAGGGHHFVSSNT